MPLLEVTDLRTYFHTRSGVYRAVDGVSFSLERGETLGIVGESGSGKSVTCYSLMGLVPQPPGKIESGSAILDGRTDLLNCPLRELNAIRGRRVAMIFQDPMTSLNPYMRVEDQIIEPLLIHKMAGRAEAVNADDVGPLAHGQRRHPAAGQPDLVHAQQRWAAVGQAEEAFEAVVLHEPGQAHPIVPGDALLAFDHHAQPHAATSFGSVTGARHTKRSQR